jgi:hypothetical protein
MIQKKSSKTNSDQHNEDVRLEALEIERAIRPKDAQRIRTRAIEEAAGQLNNERQSTISARPTPMVVLETTAIPDDSSIKR